MGVKMEEEGGKVERREDKMVDAQTEVGLI